MLNKKERKVLKMYKRTAEQFSNSKVIDMHLDKTYLEEFGYYTFVFSVTTEDGHKYIAQNSVDELKYNEFYKNKFGNGMDKWMKLFLYLSRREDDLELTEVISETEFGVDYGMTVSLA